MDSIVTIIASLFILMYSVILHEIAHGYVAERLGDPTARRAGRLTLNPIPHIDPIMTILMPLMFFFLANGRMFGGAKPVPVNPLYFDDPKKDMALVASAGALTNLALAGLGALIYHSLSVVGPVPAFVIASVQFMVYFNVLLGLFNLIPIPPLDGSRVLAALLPDNLARTLLSIEPFGFVLILFLFFATSLGALLFQFVSLGMKTLGVPF